MAYSVRKNWVTSFNLIVKQPIVLLPFFIVAFLEALALEFIYFSPRPPLANIFNPVVQKLFGPAFVHYPGNFVILPKLFYYAQIVIYIFIGVFLTAISVNIVKNIRQAHPLKADALVRNATRSYLSFFIFGVMMIGCMYLLKKFDGFIFFKVLALTAKHLPQVLLKLYSYILTCVLFFTNILLQTFLVLTIPIVVIRKEVLLTAVVNSIKIGWNSFVQVFTLIFLPFLLYLPITLLKTSAVTLIEKVFPEMNLFIAIAGIIAAAFVECFVMVCASQFLLDRVEIASAPSVPRNDGDEGASQ